MTITIFNLQGEYGEKGIGSFTQLATKSGICIGVSITINRNAASHEFLKVFLCRDAFSQKLAIHNWWLRSTAAGTCCCTEPPE